jgi:hypothetical protein
MAIMMMHSSCADVLGGLDWGAVLDCLRGVFDIVVGKNYCDKLCHTK